MDNSKKRQRTPENLTASLPDRLRLELI